MKSKSKRIALYGVWSALLFVVMYLETIITINKSTPPAVLSLSMIMMLCFFDDWKTGLISGVIFGVASNLVGLMVGNPAFIFPWIAILPRLFVGIGAYGVYRLVSNLTKNAKSTFVKKYLAYGIGASCGIIINTTLVIACLGLFCMDLFGSFTVLLQMTITINFPIELCGAVILVPVLLNVVKPKLNFNRVEVVEEKTEEIQVFEEYDTQELEDKKNQAFEDCKTQGE